MVYSPWGHKRIRHDLVINKQQQCRWQFSGYFAHQRTSLVAQTIKNLPTMQETWVQSLGWEDPLEKGMATTPVSLPEEFGHQSGLAGEP